MVFINVLYQTGTHPSLGMNIHSEMEEFQRLFDGTLHHNFVFPYNMAFPEIREDLRKIQANNPVEEMLPWLHDWPESEWAILLRVIRRQDLQDLALKYIMITSNSDLIVQYKLAWNRSNKCEIHEIASKRTIQDYVTALRHYDNLVVR